MIEFADETAVETAQAEKEQEIIADAAAENDGSIDDSAAVLATAPMMAPLMTLSLTIVKKRKRKVARPLEEEAGDTAAVGLPLHLLRRQIQRVQLLRCCLCKSKRLYGIGTIFA